MFCLAFKSPFYSSDWLAYRIKVDTASQAKGLVSFLEPVTVHHFPHRNYCWNKQLWEVSALVDPSLLTISQPLSAIAKTLLHCGAVMIALLSLGKNTGGKEDDQRLCSWRFFIMVRVIAVKLKPLNLKKKKSILNQKLPKPSKPPSQCPWWFNTLQLQEENFKSITLTLSCQACFCWGVQLLAPSLLSTQGAKEHQIVCALQMKASALGAQDVRSHLLVLKQCLHQLATFPTQNMLFFGGGAHLLLVSYKPVLTESCMSGLRPWCNLELLTVLRFL